MKLFALSDIHGRTIGLEEFEELGFDGDNPDHHIVILGDYFDRHEDNHGIYLEMVSLRNKFKNRVHLLEGNHDGFMKEFIEGTLKLNTLGQPLELEPILQERWLRNGGAITMKQCFLIDDFNGLYNKDIEKRLLEYKSFMDSLQGYVELGNYIFTHAGVDKNYHHDYWTRSYIHEANPFSNKTVILGHTPFKYCLEHEDLKLIDAPSGIGQMIMNAKLQQNIFIIDNGLGNNIVLFETH